MACNSAIRIGEPYSRTLTTLGISSEAGKSIRPCYRRNLPRKSALPCTTQRAIVNCSQENSTPPARKSTVQNIAKNSDIFHVRIYFRKSLSSSLLVKFVIKTRVCYLCCCFGNWIFLNIDFIRVSMFFPWHECFTIAIED